MELIDKYNLYKNYPANIIMKIACSTHAMRVCVCVKILFPQGLVFNEYDKKQPDFLDNRENKCKISQKSNLITY